MISIFSISALIVAYLFGSIPTAVWIGQAFYGIDVREYGSGNAGATNTFRVLGKKAGITVMLLDILKGWTATNLVYFIGLSVTGPKSSTLFVNYQLALGIVAVMGHLFPVFAGFRGGEGNRYIIWNDIGCTSRRGFNLCTGFYTGVDIDPLCILKFDCIWVYFSIEYDLYFSISNTIRDTLWYVYLYTGACNASEEY